MLLKRPILYPHPLVLPVCLLFGGLLVLSAPSAIRAQDAPPPIAPAATPPDDGNGRQPGGGNGNKTNRADKVDEAARKAMREERNRLLDQLAQIDKRIRELDQKLWGEDFAPALPHLRANSNRLFVTPQRAAPLPPNAQWFAPGQPNVQRLAPLPPNAQLFSPDLDKQLREMLKQQQNLNGQNFRNFGNRFLFDGNTLFFGGMNGANRIELFSSNAPNKPLTLRLDGMDIDSKEFDAYLENLKKTEPEREKQLRATREQLRDAQKRLKDALRSLPKSKAPSAGF